MKTHLTINFLSLGLEQKKTGRLTVHGLAVGWEVSLFFQYHGSRNITAVYPNGTGVNYTNTDSYFLDLSIFLATWS
jgi:hypothetical protein